MASAARQLTLTAVKVNEACASYAEYVTTRLRGAAKPGVFGLCPVMCPPAEDATWLAVPERRVGKQGDHDLLQCDAESHCLHHVGFGAVVKVHLRARSARKHVARREGELGFTVMTCCALIKSPAGVRCVRLQLEHCNSLRELPECRPSRRRGPVPAPRHPAPIQESRA